MIRLTVVVAIVIVIAAVLLLAVAVRASGRSFRGLISRSTGGEIKSTGPAGMVGETAVVTRAVGDEHKGGMVRGRGEEWPAYTEQPAPIEIGEKVILLDFVRGRFLVAESDLGLPTLTWPGPSSDPTDIPPGPQSDPTVIPPGPPSDPD